METSVRKQFSFVIIWFMEGNLKEIIGKIIKSWAATQGNVNTTEDILLWVRKLNDEAQVSIKECEVNDNSFWFYDDYVGEIHNRKRSFFSITGIQRYENNKLVAEQPIIVQPEIGYLGIICKEIDGVMNFLMQAKIEPGNVNVIQISPTIQATKSNYTRRHGGVLPNYFDYFYNSKKYTVIYDQVQSEQAARFYKKRNRNIIMLLDEDIEVLPNYKWMTLGQIKSLMEIDNLVNMDTRTVLSGIPLMNCGFDGDELLELKKYFKDQTLFNSIFTGGVTANMSEIYQFMNNYKMFEEKKTVLVPLNQLRDWSIDDSGVTCNHEADYMVRYYDIDITGREVKNWSQPLFKAIGKATFGLIMRTINDKKEFLVAARPEIGSFDFIELGPSVQWEPSKKEESDNEVDHLFRKKVAKKEYIMNVILSEEGGRFYHEQNYNVIMEVGENELPVIPEGYFWIDYGTLNYMIQINNCLNIQLRNLLSLLKI